MTSNPSDFLNIALQHVPPEASYKLLLPKTRRASLCGKLCERRWTRKWRQTPTSVLLVCGLPEVVALALQAMFSTYCCTGEDVGHYGGSYKVTYDLHKKYGDLRLLDTPICGMFLTFSALLHMYSGILMFSPAFWSLVTTARNNRNA